MIALQVKRESSREDTAMYMYITLWT